MFPFSRHFQNEWNHVRLLAKLNAVNRGDSGFGFGSFWLNVEGIFFADINSAEMRGIGVNLKQSKSDNFMEKFNLVKFYWIYYIIFHAA